MSLWRGKKIEIKRNKNNWANEWISDSGSAAFQFEWAGHGNLHNLCCHNVCRRTSTHEPFKEESMRCFYSSDIKVGSCFAKYNLYFRTVLFSCFKKRNIEWHSNFCFECVHNSTDFQLFRQCCIRRCHTESNGLLLLLRKIDLSHRTSVSIIKPPAQTISICSDQGEITCSWNLK